MQERSACVNPCAGRRVSVAPASGAPAMQRVIHEPAWPGCAGSRLDADDLMHENTGEENYNESAYYNFYDPAQRLGGFVRIGNRPNEGYAEMTLCLYLPDGSVGFMFGRPKIANNARFDAGGMRFEVRTPMCEHRDPLRRHGVSARTPARAPRPARRVHPEPARPGPGRARVSRASPRRTAVSCARSATAAGSACGRSIRVRSSPAGTSSSTATRRGA